MGHEPARARTPTAAVCRVLALSWLLSAAGAAAADHYGRVTFGGVPVPGATVTAIPHDPPGAAPRVTVTDQQGVYRFADIADGVWTLKVEMLGFVPASQDVTIAADAQPLTWGLKLLSFAEITRDLAPVA